MAYNSVYNSTVADGVSVIQGQLALTSDFEPALTPQVPNSAA